jgi:hypothetical protein
MLEITKPNLLRKSILTLTGEVKSLSLTVKGEEAE